jgi:single-strand DNA-binding protein
MLNRVTLIGNLGKDPEVKRLGNGTPVAKFSIATTESYKDTNGEWQNQTEWHDIILWRGQAEYAEKNLKKGFSVFIEGKLTHRQYTDKNGVERYTTEVVASIVRLLEKTEKKESNFPSEAPPQREYASTAMVSKEETPVSFPTSEPQQVSEDGLPF